MAIKRQFFGYKLDNEGDVAIRIDYSDSINPSVDERLEFGNFNSDDAIVQCQGLVLERRLLKPRRVTVLTEDNKELDVIIKDLDTYIDLLNNPDTNLGLIIRSFGEINNTISASN